MDRELLLLEEVAELCRAPLSSVRHWIRVGKLPSLRPGRRRLVEREALERFLVAASHAGTPRGAQSEPDPRQTKIDDFISRSGAAAAGEKFRGPSPAGSKGKA